MSRGSILARLALVAMLSSLIVGASASPVAAGDVKRFEATERLAHKLVNCLRTGGKVTYEGKCRGYGSGKFSVKRAPLKFSKKISNQVSWPWARRTVKVDYCGHVYSGSTVDKRFRSVGLRHADNGENIGCARGWSPRRMVITMVRWWFDEKRWGGPHWRQLKAKKFKSAGFGVAKRSDGRTRLVVNFYGKIVP